MFGRKRREFMNRPIGEGPTGVWVEYPRAGRYENLPVIYAGRAKDGTDLYEVLLPLDLEEERPRSMGVNRFPGRTALKLPMLAGMGVPRIEEIEQPERPE